MWLSAAFAAGFTVGDPGACAAARPCVAGASGLADGWSNPASAADVAGTAVAASVGIGTFLGAFEGTGSSRAKLAPTPIPRLAVAARRGRWIVGAAAGPPADGVRQIWPADGAQRYALQSRALAVVDAGPLLAFRTNHLAIGAGAALSALSFEQSLAATTSPGDPGFDVDTNVAGAGVAAVARAGVRVDLDRIRVGASFRTGARYEADGPLSVDFSRNAYFLGTTAQGRVIADAVTTDPSVTTPIVLPPSARLGIEAAFGDARVEVAGGWEGWRIVQDLTVERVDLRIATTGGAPIVVDDDIRLPLPLRDTWMLGLGGEVRRDGTAWRAGVRYESGAADDLVRSALIADPAKVGAGLGVARDPDGPWSWALAVAGNVGIEPDLSRSIAAQVAIDPLTGRVGFGELAGRGRLQAADLRIVVSAEWGRP